MTEKAARQGLCENFGQKEIAQLKDRYGYNPYGSEHERQIADTIDQLDNYCQTLTL